MIDALFVTEPPPVLLVASGATEVGLETSGRELERRGLSVSTVTAAGGPDGGTGAKDAAFGPPVGECVAGFLAGTAGRPMAGGSAR